jgi:hypothetical protein
MKNQNVLKTTDKSRMIDFIKENSILIEELKNEYGKKYWMEEFYKETNVQTFMDSFIPTKEELEDYGHGWTDERDELFWKLLNKKLV